MARVLLVKWVKEKYLLVADKSNKNRITKGLQSFCKHFIHTKKRIQVA